VTAESRPAPSRATRLRGVRPSLGLAVALLLLALPVASAIWVVGELAARQEVTEVDGRLATALRVGVAEYQGHASEADVRARELAASPRVQRALAAGDRAAIARVETANPGVTLVPGRTAPPPGETIALRREVVVQRGGRRVGLVRVSVPFDERLVAGLEAGAALPAGTRLALASADGTAVARGGRGSATRRANGRLEISLSGERHRAVSVPLLRHPARVSLAALAPEAALATAQRRARVLVLLTGLVLLAGVVVIGYLAAPLIARARVARQQGETAAKVLEHVGDGVCLVDEGGTIRLWNPAAEAITGVPADAVHGRPAEAAIPGWAALERRVAAEGDPGAAVTLPLDADGRELWLSVSAVRFPAGVVYAFRDLTEERRLEEMRQDLVATVSHELRTPLASVHGAALTLERRGPELDESTRGELLAVIADESARLGRLADGMLLASQLTGGDPPLREGPFDADDVARAAVASARREAPPGVSIELLVGGSLPPVAGDGERARQVLEGLLDNAVKYSPEGGRVELVVKAQDDCVRFTVRDEGIGIPPGEQERIFEKFYRLDPDLRRGVGGPGLGLYICRELVRRMHGRIAVESEPGHGSSFTVDLPAAGARAAA
jgi:PAS domain S-box-containing protein